mmetsp:Transcript_11478/g.32536  ORF Transcript_11478/g.32536 Transcript_11478/m.32536 type:complete len:90 (+) Transcript_11478:127-396(+)
MCWFFGASWDDTEENDRRKGDRCQVLWAQSKISQNGSVGWVVSLQSVALLAVLVQCVQSVECRSGHIIVAQGILSWHDRSLLYGHTFPT